jgi:hypothetical protein
MLPLGNQCGHLFTGQPSECERGVGDPYVEIDWSRNFGTFRPSKYPGAYPILQGLSLLVGFGVVFPAGQYQDADLLEQELSPGTNIWDFAPTVGMTYTTRPVLAEGTEFSAKAYLNNYLENPSTRYYTGKVVNIDFAVTERIGRFQVGVAGFYAWQIEDDELLGVPIPPDGRRAEALQLGPIVNYDMPESGSSLRLKSYKAIHVRNTVTSWNVVFGWLKKF